MKCNLNTLLCHFNLLHNTAGLSSYYCQNKPVAPNMKTDRRWSTNFTVVEVMVFISEYSECPSFNSLKCFLCDAHCTRASLIVIESICSFMCVFATLAKLHVLLLQMEAGSHSRVIIHIDMDCFYAQVEERRDPALSGRPLGVRQKNIVVTCNYEARAAGVRKCMMVEDALRICPGMNLVIGEDLAPYRHASAQVIMPLIK